MAGPEYSVSSQSTVQVLGGSGSHQNRTMQHTPAHPCKTALAVARLVPEF